MKKLDRMIEKLKKIKDEKEISEELRGLTLSAPKKVLRAGEKCAFSVAPGLSCPGATEFCSSRCYACSGNHLYPAPLKANLRNFLILEKAFAQGDQNRLALILGAMVCSSIGGLLGFFRIHESGDFWRQEVVDLWVKIAQNAPHIRFFAYTRSFELDFSAFQALENTVLWASADPDNRVGAQNFSKKHKAPIAVMSPKKEKTEKNGILCPYIGGKSENCFKCGLCWRGETPQIMYENQKYLHFPAHS